VLLLYQYKGQQDGEFVPYLVFNCHYHIPNRTTSKALCCLPAVWLSLTHFISFTITPHYYSTLSQVVPPVVCPQRGRMLIPYFATTNVWMEPLSGGGSQLACLGCHNSKCMKEKSIEMWTQSSLIFSYWEEPMLLQRN